MDTDANPAAPRPRTAASIATLAVAVAALVLVAWLALGPFEADLAAILGGFAFLCVFALVIRPGAASSDRSARATRSAVLGSRQGQLAFPALLAGAVAIPALTGEAMWAPLVGMVGGLLVVAAVHSGTFLFGQRR
jgi:hypothetical protein